MSKLRTITSTLLVTLALAVVLAPIVSAAPPTGVHSGRPLAATLTGAAEVPAGDPDGAGTAKLRLNQGQRRICYQISVTNIVLPATAAHIHTGAAGVAGAVVVPLGAPDASGNVTGCVNGVDRSLIKAIRQDPAAYYVNVHNSVYPAGAVRGQLEKWAPGQ